MITASGAQSHPGSYYADTINHPLVTEQLSVEIDADICVIGGGYSGVSSALHLAERGYSVVLLEASKIGWGASGRNGGQLCSGQHKDQDELENMLGFEKAQQLWALAEEAKHSVKALVDKFSIDCDYKPGNAHPDHKARYAEETRRYVDKLNQQYGYQQIEYLDATEMAEVTGSQSYFGGSLDHGAAHLHPLNYLLGLAHAARSAGARLYEHSEVTGYDVNGVIHVRTQQGQVRANRLVLACNAYLGKLEPRLKGRIMPINNFIVATEPLDEKLAEQVNPRDVAIADSRFVINYYRLSADKRLLFGGGENYRRGFPHNIANFVRKPMLQVYPYLKNIRIDYAWGGTLAVTLNRLPHFGTLENDRIVYAEGYSGHGVALATLAGKLVAEKISGCSNQFDLMAAIPTPRFPGGSLLRWPSMVAGMAYYALRDRI